jgi:hypothetical protein
MKRARPQPDFLDELIESGSRQNADSGNSSTQPSIDASSYASSSADAKHSVSRSETSRSKWARPSRQSPRLESGEVDARGSTIERFATAVGRRIEYRLAGKPRQRSAGLARA